ncbi:alcohol dehydrogenase [Halanaerobium saccharolyticum]|uniref:Alcohol dehydrogenase n=1 Tax=Halanaerobium saccharolyticum TaxID=43595 RepID=A0A4R7YV27_9FIRM|nr:iron-containing alcohol dehydrogenase [Halanaerobium saccharolyticum]RAK06937.1 alcohol dehydrogenase [Halanaerobium saccharolyticum]TDW01664.1 alcohol dehydrogenase [Halanaerobium saccharolyticum]TDX53062.1 alcohol dehydrogenase [Halanaerobium saccharolyticum]
MNLKEKAKELLYDFKGDEYALGVGILNKVGEYAKEYGDNVLLISNDTYRETAVREIQKSLKENKIKIAGNRVFPGSNPNAPREDVYRLAGYIHTFEPDCIIVIGGGSTIDAVKAANVLASLGHYSPHIDKYFGTDMVTEALEHSKEHLIPTIAVQTASSSGAHLTKYSNVTDVVSGQKKLIVDDAVIPKKSVFDYEVTKTMPLKVTVDGAFDGLAHCLEVFYGIDAQNYNLEKEIASTAVELIVKNTPKVIGDLQDTEAREALGLATDLGAYSIMVGGTNGGHLTSFSLVDVSSHGRACGIMNIYYTVFFAPAIEPQLKVLGDIFIRNGFLDADLNDLSGRQLGEAVARAMINFAEEINFPTKLSELDGFTDQHIERALEAAKDPQLEMKLKNMPIPLNASMVDEYMAPILEAAKTGDLSLIKNIEA